MEQPSPDAIPCPACGALGRGRHCSACGAELRPPSAAAGAARAALAPFLDYARQSRRMLRPARMAAEIRAGRLRAPRLFAFALSALALLAPIAWAFPEMAPPSGLPPVAAELVLAAMMFVMPVALNWPLHLLFNRGGPGVRLRHFALATVAIATLFLPWLALIGGLAQAWDLPMLAQLVSIAPLGFYALTYRALYGRSLLFVCLGMLFYAIAVWLALAALAFLVLGYADPPIRSGPV